MLLLPAEVRANVLVGWQAATGLTPSETVTCEVQVAVRPARSVTVSVMVRGVPMSEQETVGEVVSTRLPVGVQLSLEPLFSVVPGMVLLPVVVNVKVVFALQRAVGFIPSVTVTRLVQLSVRPAPSVAIMVMVTGVPMLAHDTVGEEV